MPPQCLDLTLEGRSHLGRESSHPGPCGRRVQGCLCPIGEDDSARDIDAAASVHEPVYDRGGRPVNACGDVARIRQPCT